MSIKHTPGPWETDGQTVYAERAYFDGPVRIATCKQLLLLPSTSRVAEQTEKLNTHLLAEREANARLIAAAPGLLAALKFCQRWLEPLIEQVPPQCRASVEDMLSKARAAAYKAEGSK